MQTPAVSESAVTENGLMIFTRYPEPGRTKTRLIPHLGAEGAASLQRSMTEYLLRRMRGMVQQASLVIEVHFSGGNAHQMQNWLGHGLTYRPQTGGDLGQRLHTAFHHGFANGRRRLLAVGSDCPSLQSAQILRALRLLQTHDLVLGPAKDGGYYLIGLNRPMPHLFEGIDWGTDRVLLQTVAIASRHHLTPAFLTPLSDIDRPEDLPIWHQLSSNAAGATSNPQTAL